MVLYMVVASRPSEGSDGNELRNRVKANLSAGDIHYGKGNYSYALRYYVTALKLSEAAKGHPYLAVLYKNMGNVYSMFQDFEKGKSLYLSGLEEACRVKDSETAYKLLQNLVGVCISLGDVGAPGVILKSRRGKPMWRRTRACTWTAIYRLSCRGMRGGTGSRWRSSRSLPVCRPGRGFRRAMSVRLTVR